LETGEQDQSLGKSVRDLAGTKITEAYQSATSRNDIRGLMRFARKSRKAWLATPPSQMERRHIKDAIVIWKAKLFVVGLSRTSTH